MQSPVSTPRISLLDRLIDGLLKYRNPLLLISMLLTIAAIPAAARLQFDQSIESLYAADNPRLIDFLASKRAFGGDEFAIVAYTDPELFTPAGMERVQALSAKLSQVPGVRSGSTQNLADAMSLSSVPLPGRLRELFRNRVSDQLRELFRGILLGEDNQTTAIILRLKRYSGKVAAGLFRDAGYAPSTPTSNENRDPSADADDFQSTAVRTSSADESNGDGSNGDASNEQAAAGKAGLDNRVAAENVATAENAASNMDGSNAGTPDGLPPGGSDRSSAAGSVQPDRPVSRTVTIAEIRKIAAEHSFPTYVVGEPVQLNDMFRYVEEDGAVLGWASSALLMVVILVLFRRVRWVLLPLLVVHVTLVWTKAILVIAGLQLSMVSSMLTSLVTIIAVATCIHVTVFYREFRKELPREAALRATFGRLVVPIFWTCATTAAGFASQMTSHIHPVESFGLMTGLATMLVLVVVLMILPGGILVGTQSGDPQPTPANDYLSNALDRISHLVDTVPYQILAVMIAVVAFSIWGFRDVQVETDFSKNFRETSPIVTGLNFVETRLGGAGTWEVSVPAPEKWDTEALTRLAEFADELRALKSDGQPALTKVTALSDGVSLIPTIPFVSGTQQQKLSILASIQPEFIPSLYNEKLNRQRVMLRARERQPSRQKLELIATVEALGKKYYPEGPVRCSGLFVLITFLIDSLLSDQWLSFAIAAAAISCMMAVAFRSVLIGVLSLLPNLLPIVAVIGVMGWAGLKLDLGTAMIASVSMGLTIDSSIHYLAGFDLARRRGISVKQAIFETSQGVGSSLVYANCALVLGFLVLMLSNFIPLVHFGLLVSVAMVGGLVGNLLLLPLLLKLLVRDKSASTTAPVASPSM